MIEDGVYFQLDERDYHNVPALSASGVKNILISNPDFWFRSVFNPHRENNDTEARLIGRAFHKRILEGREAFYSEYATTFEAPENCIRTVDDLRDALIKSGVEKPKGLKPDLIEQLLEIQPGAQILDELRTDYELLHHGKEFLSSDLIHSIEVSAAMIEKHPVISKCFSGGYPEVSVIWTEEGVRFKARFDYLKPRAIVDLKTFANFMNKPIDGAIYSSMASGKYHIQAAFYLRAAEMAKRLPEWHGCQLDFRLNFRECAEHDFFFVFQAKGPAPLARLKKFTRGSLWSCGEVAIDEAIRRYKACMEHYGPDVPWLDDAQPEDLDDSLMPVYATEL